MNKSKSYKHSKTAFTLVELLVVIAIISVLAGMLMPALENALGSARSVTCMNNLRQQGSVFGYYQNDYSGYFVPYICSRGNWVKNMFYLGYFTGAIFVCPEKNSSYPEIYKWQSLESSLVPGDGIWGHPDYGYNQWHMGGGSEHVGNWYPPMNLSEFSKPTETVVTADSAAVDRSDGATYCFIYHRTDKPIAWPTHEGACQILWVDQHVSKAWGDYGPTEASAEQIYSNGNPLQSSAWSGN